jgi:hypothetical protein
MLLTAMAVLLTFMKWWACAGVGGMGVMRVLTFEDWCMGFLPVPGDRAPQLMWPHQK